MSNLSQTIDSLLLPVEMHVVRMELSKESCLTLTKFSQPLTCALARTLAEPLTSCLWREDGKLSATVFTDVTKFCEGESNTTTIEVGKCQTISGVIFGDNVAVFAQIDPALEGTKLGNDAMTKSVSLLALVVFIIGVLMSIAY